MRRASSFRLLSGALAPGCGASWIRLEDCITCFARPRFHDVMLLLTNGPNQNTHSKLQGSSPLAFRAWGDYTRGLLEPKGVAPGGQSMSGWAGRRLWAVKGIWD